MVLYLETMVEWASHQRLKWNIQMFISIDTKKRLFSIDRAVFKWLTWKVMTQFPLPRRVIGVEISRQCVNQWEAKPKPNAPCKRSFSRAFSNLLVTARNSDCFIALFASVVIGRSSYFVILVSRQSIETDFEGVRTRKLEESGGIFGWIFQKGIFQRTFQ